MRQERKSSPMPARKRTKRFPIRPLWRPGKRPIIGPFRSFRLMRASFIRRAILISLFFSSFFFSLLGMSGCGTVPKIIVLKDPLSNEEHLRLGLSYEAQGQWDLALSEYDAALKKGGPSSVIEGYRGTVYFSRKDYSSAEDAYRKSLSENPRNAPVLNNLASLYLVRKENLEEAERLVRRALEIDPPRKPYYLDTLGALFLERNE